jgi:hypothetical protein
VGVDRRQGVLPDEIVKQIMLVLKQTPLDIYLQDGTHA